MTKRENALRILRFDRPDHVMTGLPGHWMAYRGCNHEGYDGIGDDNVPVDGSWTDIWGTVWEKKQKGVMGFPAWLPLAEVESLRSFRWPSPDDERICGLIYTMAEARSDMDTFLTGSHRNLLLEKAEQLVGMENLFTYFYTEPNFVKELFHHYMDFQLGIARHYIKLGVEAIQFSEDLGTQKSLIVGPEIMEEFMLPEYERLFRVYREKGVLLELHSCGHVEPILPLLMELGIDVLNPIQATANNLDNIRATTQGRMALHGGVRSDIVLDGPAERIVEETRRRIAQLGSAGGYFCSVDQHLDFPPEHVDVMNRTIQQFGCYDADGRLYIG
ncbi:MAG: hypothetical protein FWE88_08610 [Phycisphaerae bacterium]|nr:hypothetical protein [Phycisphaerae bacterium]